MKYHEHYKDGEKFKFLKTNALELERVFREPSHRVVSFLKRSLLATITESGIVFSPAQFLCTGYFYLWRRGLRATGNDTMGVAQALFVHLYHAPDKDFYVYASRGLEKTVRNHKRVTLEMTRIRIADGKDQIRPNKGENVVWTRSVQVDYQKLLRELAEVKNVEDPHRPKESRPIERKVRNVIQEIRREVVAV